MKIYLRQTIISFIVFVVSFYWAFYGNLFGEDYKQMQVFILAMLCGWSIREVWNYA